MVIFIPWDPNPKQIQGLDKLTIMHSMQFTANARPTLDLKKKNALKESQQLSTTSPPKSVFTPFLLNQNPPQ